MTARYIIRVDDASEYMDHSKWDPFFDLFDKYQIRPIIAVIPFNKDPKMANNKADVNFWERVRNWQLKGYRIGLHGFEHKYSNHNSGIIGMNKYSEFAGVPFENQMEMISKAYNKFEDERVRPDIFVAPAHSFDKNTLKALKTHGNIKCISDGFFFNPVIRDEIKWIPQQLWGPEIKSKGVWTICYHPETSDNSVVNSLNLFLKDNIEAFVDPLSLEFHKMEFEDFVYSKYMKFYMEVRSVFNFFKR
jgi:hypothetical protein